MKEVGTHRIRIIDFNNAFLVESVVRLSQNSEFIKKSTEVFQTSDEATEIISTNKKRASRVKRIADAGMFTGTVGIWVNVIDSTLNESRSEQNLITILGIFAIVFGTGLIRAISKDKETKTSQQLLAISEMKNSGENSFAKTYPFE